MLSQKNQYLLKCARQTMQHKAESVAVLKGFAFEIEKAVVNTNTGNDQLEWLRNAGHLTAALATVQIF